MGPSQPYDSQLFSIDVRVYYEDTDALGMVYYANYLKFFERARSDWLHELGLPLPGQGLPCAHAFVVKEITVDYIKPAVLYDNLSVSCKILRARAARLWIQQEIYRESTLLSKASLLLACLNPQTLRPTILPKAILAVDNPY